MTDDSETMAAVIVTGLLVLLGAVACHAAPKGLRRLSKWIVVPVLAICFAVAYRWFDALSPVVIAVAVVSFLKYAWDSRQKDGGWPTMDPKFSDPKQPALDSINVNLTSADAQFIVQGLVELGFQFPPFEAKARAIAVKLGDESNYSAARNFRLQRQRDEGWRRNA